MRVPAVGAGFPACIDPAAPEGETMFCDKCGGENRGSAAFCSHCGTKMPDVTRISGSGETSKKSPAGGGEDYIEQFIAHIAGRYTITRELGRGGMAIVFLASDKTLEREVALKLLPQQFSNDDQFAKRFLHEAKISAKLSHPNIIPIHDVYRDGDFTYYSMAYINGTPPGTALPQGDRASGHSDMFRASARPRPWCCPS